MTFSKDLKSTLKQTKGTSSSNEKQVKELQTEIRTLKAKLQDIGEEKAHLEALKNRKAREVDDWKLKHKNLNNETKKLKAQVDKLKDEITESNDKANEYKQMYFNTEKKCEQFKEENETLKSTKDEDTKLKHYMTQTKELNEKVIEQRERIHHLESTLKSTNEKPPRPHSSFQKEAGHATCLDSTRMPTFSNNVFTQEAEEDSRSNNYHQDSKNVSL